MLNIYVLDITAESRNRIIQEINNFLRHDLPDNFLIPRINLKPIALNEVKFHAAPDVCIVGSDFVSMELSELGNLRKILPDTAIVVKTKPSLENISIFEQFARMGVDDTFSENITALDFFKKIILLAKRRVKARTGQLIVVDSAKGGQGTTSIVAAIGEVLLEQGKKVLLVDLDSETQDLSRFLQVKPFVNENLQLLVDQQRPISDETVMQCVLPVWQNEENLYCMPPISDSEGIYDPRSNHAKIFLSIYDALDQLFDYVIVDAASIKGAVARTIYRIADKIICLVNNDPASLYSATQKIQRIRANMSPNAKLKVMECAPYRHALPSNLVRSEISRAAKVDASDWLPQVIPYCVHASRWPGSGNTIFSTGSRGLVKAITANLEALDFIEKDKEAVKVRWKFGFKEKAAQTKKKLPEIEHKPMQHVVAADLTKVVPSEKLELPSPEDLVGTASLFEEAPTVNNGANNSHESEAKLKKPEDDLLVSDVQFN